MNQADGRRLLSTDALHFVNARDGTRLAVSIVLPDAAQSRALPTFVRMTRYPRGPIDAAQDAALSEAGFAVIVVDERGTGGSGGERLLPWSPAVDGDADDVIRWIMRQPWSNGRVATYGVSYDGASAEGAAASGAPGLGAAALLFIGSDPYVDIVYPGGILNDWFMRHWSEWNGALGLGEECLVDGTGGSAHANGSDPSTYEAVLRAPHRDDSLAGFTYDDISGLARQPVISDSGVAEYALASWYDAAFARGALERFVRGAGTQFLTIGPWNHGGSHFVDPLRPRLGAEPHVHVELRAMLRSIGRRLATPESSPPVHALRYYTLGEGRWHSSKSWPPRGVSTVPVYLASGRRLAHGKPAPGQAAPTRYRVVREASSGDATRWHTTMCGWPVAYEDRAERDSMLSTFTSPPLARPITITGSPWAKLWFSATSPDASVFVYLEAVAPDGGVVYLTEGQLRVCHRATQGLTPLGPAHSFKRRDAAPLGRGEITALDIGLLPISARVPSGHRLRLAIAGADCGIFATVPPSGSVTFSIYHDSARRSALNLPVQGGASRVAFAAPEPSPSQ